MAKARTSYVCQNCEYSQVGWSGKCPNCGEWNTLVETILSTGSPSNTSRSGGIKVDPVPLNSVKVENTKRVTTKIPELDRVLGGGIVPGQVILIAGEPGIGKSTLLLELTNNIDEALYISGEESAGQIAIRGIRLGINKKSIQILETTSIDTAISAIQDLPKNTSKSQVVIVDSIQTMQTSDLSGMAGSVGQVRECAYRLVGIAKNTGVPIFIVGHVTKEGTVGGPSVLAHLVDTVLWFEGDKHSTLRVLRANKNRFGSTDEVGIFKMEEKGLISIENPASIFVGEGKKAVAGSCLTSVLEGTRPILAEIQSLVVPTKMAMPRRVVQGIDQKRAEIILAILARRAGIPANNSDVFINVVGGISIKEPGTDLALALSIASAYFDKPLPKSLVAMGELDLLGEVREAQGQDRRIKEAKRLGYKNIVSSKDATYVSQVVKKYLR